MKKTLPIIFMVFIYIINNVSACVISPSSWDVGKISPGSFITKTFTVDATNETCDLTATTDWIAFSKSHFENTVETFQVYLTIPSTADLTSYTEKIKTDGSDAVTVSFLVGKSEGYLEPTFSTLIMTVEEGVKTSRVISIRNNYPDKVQIVDVQKIGTIETKEGVSKPIDIEGEFGWLESGEDLSLKVNINTEGLEANTYTPKLEIAYYYQGERKTLTINFDITVTSSIIPGGSQQTEQQKNKTMNLAITPEEPMPGESVMLDVYDDKNNIISDATIKVQVIDPETDETVTQFLYYQPFKVEANKKYKIIAQKEGYNSVTKAFVVELGKSMIKLSPSNPKPGEMTMIQYTNLDGVIISGGKLIIDGEEYPAPQTSISFSSGTHNITGKAVGYEEASLSIKVVEELQILEIPEEWYVGQSGLITFNRDADWKIYDSDGNLLYSGTSKSINFTAETPGNYTLNLEGNSLTLEVKEHVFDMFYVNLIIVVIVAFILFIKPGILRKMFGRRQKFDIETKLPEEI